MEGCFGTISGQYAGQLSKGLEQLKNEHPPLLSLIDGLMDRTLTIVRNCNAELFKELRSAVLEFLSELEPHSTREETVLFDMMAAYIGREMGPIAVMEYEHDRAKSLIGTFVENTKSGIEGYPEEEMLSDCALIREACDTLIDHFAKEESILFPMAERLLNGEEKAELLERIQKI
ncbi:hemerythrin domain-containing protein [Mesobacillus zeae]|uniref:Hemerythrin domain-containing protein n=1 Tax=Mesobacillus zeae TaxID=1917180 RepID=A0A398BK38_9BACI|nr:hemerythrin domain-containing protein [Mesobacillus zeae]RID87806.1 hemerythrin domain-containing protein [Mesobacillus zeae]